MTSGVNMEDFLDFHKEKTRISADLEKFMLKASKFDAEQTAKELADLNKKLVVPFVDDRTGAKVLVDISNNAEQKNRLYFRKKISTIAKWISVAIKRSNADYSAMWNLMNATFASKTIMPDFENGRLLVEDRFSFMDTLSLDGMIKYKQFLTIIAHKVLAEDYSFASACRLAKNQVFGFVNNDQTIYDSKTLPTTWNTYYKHTMKQKILLEHQKWLKNQEQKEQGFGEQAQQQQFEF